MTDENLLTISLQNQFSPENISILIVDDEPDLIEVLALSLSAFGYAVHTAKNGREAIEQANKILPNLIVMDINMPKMNGIDAIKILKSEFKTSQIPVLLLTALSDTQSLINGVDAGADEFITKPYKTLELKARIEMVLLRNMKTVAINPTTKLPGNETIRSEINRRLSTKEKFALCYLDIDCFKAYNDKYGYDNGDTIIQRTAEIIVRSLENAGHKTDFVGHIGGDDFIFISKLDTFESVCNEICLVFDNYTPPLYTNDDQKNGYIESIDRSGNPQKFSLMHLSIGVVTNKSLRFKNYIRMSEYAAQMKSFAKKFNESCFKIYTRKK